MLLAQPPPSVSLTMMVCTATSGSRTVKYWGTREPPTAPSPSSRTLEPSVSSSGSAPPRFVMDPFTLAPGLSVSPQSYN